MVGLKHKYQKPEADQLGFDPCATRLGTDCITSWGLNFVEWEMGIIL